MAENKINPYGQHYRSTARLFRNSTINDIYTFLLDEYMVLLRNNIPSPSLHFPLSHIAEGAGVYRGCVKSNLDKLSQLKVIFSTDEEYTTIFMRTNYFESVVSLFNSKSTLKEKHEVEKAFRNADIVALNKLGYEECEDGDSQLLSLEGSMNVGEVANMSLKQQTCRSTDINVGTPTCLSVEQQSCRFSSKHVALPTCLSVLHHSLGAIFDEFPQKSDFIRYISGLKCDVESENIAFELADLLYSEEITEDSPILTEIGVLLAAFTLKSGMSLNQQSCRLSDNSMSVERHEIEESCRFSDNRNKYINKKETKPADEENEDELSEEDFDFSEEQLNQAEPERETVRKPKTVYPLFPVDEVDLIVNDIQEACKSPLRLFLYNFWGYASDMTNTCDEHDVDENGNETISEESFFDPEGSPMDLMDFNQILEEAYEATSDDIEKGSPADDDNIEISFKEMFDYKLLRKIFDWKSASLDGKTRSVIISRQGIRNIEAEVIETIKKPQGREEIREAANACKDFMKQLWDNRDNYPQLTTIEKIILRIVQDYFKPSNDPDRPLTLKGSSIITRDEWRLLSTEIEKTGITIPEFFKCIVNNDAPSGDQVTLNNAPFYVEGIRYINQIRQEESIIVA